MPAEYHIYEGLGLKYMTIRGSSDLDELRRLATTYLKDPRFSFDLVQLVDVSKLTDADASFSDVFTLRSFYLRAYQQVTTPVRVAIYAPTDLGYGVSRMFTSLMIGQKIMDIRIFEFKTEALTWLGIDPESPEWAAVKGSQSE